ncbi:MAG: IMPACT family protein [Desulfobacterales bacterium]|nr:IMPACT family protein [Desulfobacterales bacterium]
MADKTYFYSVGTCDQDPVRTVELKIKRSIFIASLAHASSIDAAKAFISRISKENKTANHNCWAYVVGDSGDISHCSDAGEPAGTAGKPMLNALQSHGMTRVAAVVTRHFGGVKLGVRGLIEAYGDTVNAAIEKAPLVKLVQTVSLVVRLDYGFNDTFLNQIQRFDPTVLDTRYTDAVEHDIAVEDINAPEFITYLTEYQERGALTFSEI